MSDDELNVSSRGKSCRLKKKTRKNWTNFALESVIQTTHKVKPLSSSLPHFPSYTEGFLFLFCFVFVFFFMHVSNCVKKIVLRFLSIFWLVYASSTWTIWHWFRLLFFLKKKRVIKKILKKLREICFSYHCLIKWCLWPRLDCWTKHIQRENKKSMRGRTIGQCLYLGFIKI